VTSLHTDSDHAIAVALQEVWSEEGEFFGHVCVNVDSHEARDSTEAGAKTPGLHSGRARTDLDYAFPPMFSTTSSSLNNEFGCTCAAKGCNCDRQDTPITTSLRRSSPSFHSSGKSLLPVFWERGMY
jgi:hypothetical protein